LAAALKHLARISEPEAPSGGLTANQWSALRYFALANRFSRTVSGFAAYNATTRGTASQTVKALESAGYLTRSRRLEDQRSARIDLTDLGRSKLAEDPTNDLVRALAALPATLRGQLDRAVLRLTVWVARARRQTPFGTCLSCSHLHRGDRAQGAGRYYCRSVGSYLDPGELEGLCVLFVPAGGRV
jgi:DNA-binding MarR family transcriptional regulator